MRGMRKTSYDLGIVLKDKFKMLRINKVVTDENEAEIWDEDSSSPTNNELTQVLVPNGFEEVEAIFARSNGQLIMYNINLDDIEKYTNIEIETSYGTITINTNNIEKEFKSLLEMPELKGIVNRIDNEKGNCFSTPTYEFTNEDGSKMKIELWLYNHGFRNNQAHIFFE